jgi:hypothetical protein
MGKFNALRESTHVSTVDTDVESARSDQMKVNIDMSNTTGSKTGGGSGSGGVMSFFQKKQADRVEPTGFLATKVFTHLPEHKSVSNAAIAFAISALLALVCVFSIFSIVTSPGKFTCLFSMTIIALLTGLAHWNGPQAYMNKMFEK